MDRNTQGFASYWRNSLADAESGKGAFERRDTDAFTKWMDVTTGRLNEEIVCAFFEGVPFLLLPTSIKIYQIPLGCLLQLISPYPNVYLVLLKSTCMWGYIWWYVQVQRSWHPQ
jgi:hypothetical protein